MPCLIFRYGPEYGWQIFDYMPNSQPAPHGKFNTIRDKHGKPSLFVLHGTFNRRIISRRFTKQPHKLLESLA